MDVARTDVCVPYSDIPSVRLSPRGDTLSVDFSLIKISHDGILLNSKSDSKLTADEQPTEKSCRGEHVDFVFRKIVFQTCSRNIVPTEIDTTPNSFNFLST